MLGCYKHNLLLWNSKQTGFGTESIFLSFLRSMDMLWYTYIILAQEAAEISSGKRKTAATLLWAKVLLKWLYTHSSVVAVCQAVCWVDSWGGNGFCVTWRCCKMHMKTTKVLQANPGRGRTWPMFGYRGVAEGLKPRPCLGQKRSLL